VESYNSDNKRDRTRGQGWSGMPYRVPAVRRQDLG
jgi:hypothetical protein